jgi:hypothetical protein
MRRYAIATLLLVGCTESAPTEIAFHGEQAVLPGFSYDTGLLPAGSPVQLRLALEAGGGITADATALGGGDAVVAVAGSGRFALDAHIKLDGTLKVDVSGLSYDGPIPGIENIDIAFGGETAFDPFLLGGGTAMVSAPLPKIDLPPIPLPGGLPGHLQLTVAEGSVIDSVLTGSCAGVDGNMAQFMAKTSTSAHIVIAPTIVLMIPILGTKTYPIPNIAVDVPAIEVPMDLGAHEVDPKADSPEGTSVEASSSCGGGAGGGGGGGNGVCEIDDVSTWKATWHAPNAPFADVCTNTAIGAFETACMNPGATAETCGRFREQNAACATCLMSSPEDATWGPTVGVELPTLQNTAGCVASLISHGLSCAMSIQAYDECLDVACTSCEGRSSCKDSAANGVCAAYKDLAFSCRGSLGTEVAECFGEPLFRLQVACGSPQ